MVDRLAETDEQVMCRVYDFDYPQVAGYGATLYRCSLCGALSDEEGMSRHSLFHDSLSNREDD